MDGRRARRVLGVASDAEPAEIHRAFRARARVVHPDHGGATSAFAELVDAFTALRTPRPRAHARPALVAARPRVDCYDSPRRASPRRDFADVLRAASARLL
jgi:curved DNA-binding protein CbpA